MKKTKVALAIILAVVFIIVCMNVPTFSWFTRPYPTTATEVPAGEKMELTTKNEYPGYNGYNVSMVTTTSADGTNDSYTETTTNYSGSDIHSFTRKYFCTTITNNSGAEQNVSLYASKLSMPIADNGTLALGVNEPTRSYRNYTELTKQPYQTTDNYDMRIYFQHNNVPGWTGKNIYVCFRSPYHQNEDESRMMQWISNDGGSTFYADIPYTAYNVFFNAEGWTTADNGNTDWSMRTATIANLADSSVGQSQTQSRIFKIKDEKDNNNNRKFDGYYAVNGASVLSYCNSVQFKTGETFNTANLLSRHPNSTVQYTSSNDDVFTVDANGVITGIGEGSATLTTRVIAGNSWKDSYTVYTNVTVTAQETYDFYDVPIVKNIKIPASGGTEDKPANVVKVYWYVLNNSGSKNLTYTIDSIYLGM